MVSAVRVRRLRKGGKKEESISIAWAHKKEMGVKATEAVLHRREGACHGRGEDLFREEK